MTIKVEVYSRTELPEALRKLCRLLSLHDLDPSGIRSKWYKKRHDHYLKPSVRRRRQHTVDRKKRGIWHGFLSFAWTETGWMKTGWNGKKNRNT